MPHLVQMQKTYADQGLAAISVSVDDPGEADTREKVLKVLRDKGLTFTNFILDEPQEVWQKKLGLEGPPGVFVFNREGNVEKLFKDEFTYDDMEKLVKQLLAKK